MQQAASLDFSFSFCGKAGLVQVVLVLVIHGLLLLLNHQYKVVLFEVTSEEGQKGKFCLFLRLYKCKQTYQTTSLQAQTATRPVYYRGLGLFEYKSTILKSGLSSNKGKICESK